MNNDKVDDVETMKITLKLIRYILVYICKKIELFFEYNIKCIY